MPTIAQLLPDAENRLRSALSLDASDARIDVQILLRHALGNVSRAWLLAHEIDALGANIHAAFEASLKRRLNGEPIAYILGRREFYGLDFIVTSDTLIPRPDTETLVDAALAKIPLDQPCSVLDLGTGSGAIAIAIAAQRPQAQVTAVDASPAALAIAHQNATHLLTPLPFVGEGWGEGAIANIRLIQSDWFSALPDQTFDVIVSNPPYIAEDDIHLARGDLRFEPLSALAAGKDGLDCIREIVSKAEGHLAPNGWLMLEHGYDQAEKVSTLLGDGNFDSIMSLKDLPGILRVTLGRLPDKTILCRTQHQQNFP